MRPVKEATIAQQPAKRARFDIGQNCEYEGEIVEYGAGKFSQKEVLETLFRVRSGWICRVRAAGAVGVTRWAPSWADRW